MINYEIYKIVHLAGIFCLFLGFGAILINSLNTENQRVRALGFAAHGVGLFLIILGGFGMAARLGYARDLPHWIYAKLAIWLILGGIVTLLKRKASQFPLWLAIIFISGITAAYLAIYKPF